MYDLTKYQNAIDAAKLAGNENDLTSAVNALINSKEYKANEAEAEVAFFESHPELNP